MFKDATNEVIVIDGSTGMFATYDGAKNGFAPGREQFLKIKRTTDTSFTGQVRYHQNNGSYSEWQSAAGTLMQDGSLQLRTNVSSDIRLIRLPPDPKLEASEGNFDFSETAASGIAYYLARCQPSFGAGVFGVLPRKIEAQNWPASEEIVSGRQSVSETAVFLEEARVFVSKACPKFAAKFDYLALSYEKLDPRKIIGNESIQAKLITAFYGNANKSWLVLNLIQSRKELTAKVQANDQRAAAGRATLNRKSEFLQKYGALEMNDTSLTTLHSNPYAFEGKNVALNVNFTGMRDATTANFEQLAGMGFRGSNLIISDSIPKGIFSGPSKALLIGKVIGRTKIPELQGYSALQLKFVAVKMCNGSDDCF